MVSNQRRQIFIWSRWDAVGGHEVESSKIEYLFIFDVGEELGELAWCSSYIVDVSDGIKSKTSRWFSGKTSASRVYEKGLAADVEWDPVGSHEEETSIVPFMRGN